MEPRNLTQFTDRRKEVGQQDQPIVIDDDNDVDEGFVGSDAQLREFFGLDAELREEEDEDAEGTEFKPVLIDPPSQSRKKQTKAPTQRNVPFQEPWVLIEEYLFGTSRLRVGKSVELAAQPKFAHFLAIRQIARNNETGEVVLRGLPLNRVTALGGMLDSKLNEVHLELEDDLDDNRPLFEQSMISISLDQVLKLRCVKFTHLAFPAQSFREHTPLSRTSMTESEYATQKQLIKHTGVLVCRTVHITGYADAYERKARGRRGETTIRRLCHGEDPVGKTELESKKKQVKLAPITTRPSKASKISYGSAFGGLGGDCFGARDEGMNISWAFDQDAKACLTFKKNFPRAESYIKSAEAMIRMADEEIPYCTILHISCPCQYWSSAHTRDGKNDDANIAALFTVEPLVAKIKPLVVTLEQTAGIVGRHPAYFAALIRMLLSVGYNVRWKIVKFEEYGLASTRKRLVIYAVRIGHPLPGFPKKTHGNDENLRPLISIGDAISRVPRGIDWHLDTVTNYANPKASYSPNSQARCICTNSSDVYHPSGRRPLSVRELASLNGFPNSFVFPSQGEINMTTLKKQIGNAVPPLVWKQFMSKVKECLEDFEQGKIDELGNPIALSDVTSAANAATNRMSRLSIEPGPSRPRLAPKRRLRDMSKTLSPDPPTSAYGTIASSAAEFHAMSRNGAGRAKRTLHIDFSQDEDVENKEWHYPQKRAKQQESFVDLTTDD